METKQCNTCSIIKPLTEYSMNKRKLKDGSVSITYKHKCKTCINEQSRKNYDKDKRQERHIKNKEVNNARSRKYNEEHKEHLTEYYKKYNRENVERRRETSKKWYEKNKKLIRKREQERIKNDPEFKIVKNCRRYILKLIKVKTKSTLDYIGCSGEFLVEWLQFNYGKEVLWENTNIHIDHVYPSSRFNNKDKEELHLCFNWRNLQLMDGIQNIKKGNNIKNDIIDKQKENVYVFSELYKKDILKETTEYYEKLKELKGI